MRKLIAFNHISLDGFVAGPHGEMNWIKIDPELFGHVEQRINQGDTAMYGRVTYQLMESYWPTAADKPNATQHDKVHAHWYKHVHKVVLSQSMKGQSLTNTTIISDRLTENIHRVKQSANGATSDILLFGSPSATHALIQLGLIDGYWLFVNPIILGKGIPLFVDGQAQENLKLLSTRTFASGVTELNYVKQG